MMPCAHQALAMGKNKVLDKDEMQACTYRWCGSQIHRGSISCKTVFSSTVVAIISPCTPDMYVGSTQVQRFISEPDSNEHTRVS